MRTASLALVTALAGCAGNGSPGHVDAHSSALTPIACQSQQDCAARGGQCVNGQCSATNECLKDADCPQGESCFPDDNFGGLCATSKSTLQPQPPWACALGKDCPAGQGCGSDGACHVDGECSVAQGCPNGGLCYNAGNDSDKGFCDLDRPSHDVYCRGDGAGACRDECNSDGSCAGGGSCQAGFCHQAGECASANDCSPNHLCLAASSSEDYGYDTCQPDPNPQCVPDGKGACRLACATDADCLDGGGCGADKLCHASNECQVDADCNDPNQKCYSSPEFGGLCGAIGR
jgi:hypothetical protein